MTENNAAQPGLTDAQIENIRIRAEKDSRRFGRTVDIPLRADLLLALLSKLRAEGVQADEERAAFEEWDRLFTVYCGAAQGVDAGKAANALVAFTRAALASAPVAEPETMEEIHRRERERAPWVLPKDPTLPHSAPVAGEANTGNHHTLKTDPEVFQAVMTGAKTFEIRLNDRGFQVGDALRLRETRFTGAEMREGKPLEYTGRECHRVVSHVLTGYGLADGWCCLSFAAPQASEAVRSSIPPTKPLPDLMMASYHEAIGWNACRAAMIKSAVQADKEGAAVDLSAVSDIALEVELRKRGSAPNIRSDQCAYELGYFNPSLPRPTVQFAHAIFAFAYQCGQADAQNHAPINRDYRVDDYDEGFERKGGGDCAKGAGDVAMRDAAFEAVRKQLCKLPRYSFFVRPKSSGGVQRVNDRSGNWIEFDDAHALFDPVSVDAALSAQSEANDE
ncbi:MAG: ASCH/PUA domain-containing protein [Achromobacter sp.]|uniref:ASCH/PUA domain-containing protein n=1 Tax=Achromobacter sp. TaxID=134375 RepID=UPI003D06CF2F